VVKTSFTGRVLLENVVSVELLGGSESQRAREKGAGRGINAKDALLKNCIKFTQQMAFLFSTAQIRSVWRHT
jgi:hypothetical protein